MTTGKCNDCGKSRMNGSVRCARCHNAWVLMHQMMTNYYKEQKQEDYCGLDPLLTGEHDPFYQSGACPTHDHDFDRWKAGEKVKGGLVGVSARWMRDTSKAFLTSVWGVVGFPFYLVGGLIGGAIRWRMVAPKIEPDNSTEDEQI